MFTMLQKVEHSLNQKSSSLVFGFCVDFENEQLIKDLKKFKKKQIEKDRQENWEKIQNHMNLSKKKHYIGWKRRHFKTNKTINE